jgi:flagellar protein FliL
MSHLDEAPTNLVAGAGARRSALRSWPGLAIVFVFVLVTAIGGGAGYWYLFLRGQSASTAAQMPQPEAPLPVYLEIKPFVVSIVNSASASHFVQLGLSLTVAGAAAGNAVTAILPEVQDAIRQAALGFKVEEVATPAGVDKMREAMVESANRVLLQRLGAERIKRLNGDEPKGGLVQNIYFTTLIVE